MREGSSETPKWKISRQEDSPCLFALRRQKGKIPVESISRVCFDKIRGNVPGGIFPVVPVSFKPIDYNGNFNNFPGSMARMAIP